MREAAEGGHERATAPRQQTTLTRRTSMLRLPSSCAAGALILALAVSNPAAAQAPAPSPAAAAAPTTSFAPTLAATRRGISVEGHAPLTINASATRMGPREGRACALVGGAAVITGILIGGDAGTVIAIGGAGLGLYGLYIWQR
jgi:hypothetical protein